jgi:hypothetical protein
MELRKKISSLASSVRALASRVLHGAVSLGKSLLNRVTPQRWKKAPAPAAEDQSYQDVKDSELLPDSAPDAAPAAPAADVAAEADPEITVSVAPVAVPAVAPQPAPEALKYKHKESTKKKGYTTKVVLSKRGLKSRFSLLSLAGLTAVFGATSIVSSVKEARQEAEVEEMKELVYAQQIALERAKMENQVLKMMIVMQSKEQGGDDAPQSGKAPLLSPGIPMKDPKTNPPAKVLPLPLPPGQSM